MKVYDNRLLAQDSYLFSQDNFQMKRVDLSKLKQQRVCDAEFIGNDSVYQAILSEVTQHLELQNIKIIELLFSSYANIESLDIKGCPKKIFCLQNQQFNEKILDFSYFTKLKSIKLEQLTKDILLPSSLDDLFLYQYGKMYNILNKTISSKRIFLISFNLMNTNFQNCEILELEDVTFNQSILDLSGIKTLKIVKIDNICYNILLPNILLELNLSQNNLNIYYNYVILNKTITVKDLQIRNYNLGTLDFIGCQTINFDNIIVQQRILDLSQIGSLQDVRLLNIQNNILLPRQLDTLDLSQYVYQTNKILNKKLSCQHLALNGYTLLNGMLDDCKSISLQSIIPKQSIFDLRIFKNLKQISLVDVKGDIILPSVIDYLSLFQSEELQFMLLNSTLQCKNIYISHFNLSQNIFQDCQEIQLRNCTINNLNIQHLLSQSLSTLKKCILTNITNPISRAILDLSLFINLTKIIIKETIISGIIFGISQTEIYVTYWKSGINSYYQLPNNLDILDLSLCSQLKIAAIHDQMIKQVFLTSNKCQFKLCKIDEMYLIDTDYNHSQIDKIISEYMPYSVMMYKEGDNKYVPIIFSKKGKVDNM